MPALVNNNVGSFCGTSELEATTWWPWFWKNSRNVRRTSAACIATQVYHASVLQQPRFREGLRGQLTHAFVRDPKALHRADGPVHEQEKRDEREHEDAVHRGVRDPADHRDIEDRDDPDRDPCVGALSTQQLEHLVDVLAELVAAVALPGERVTDAMTHRTATRRSSWGARHAAGLTLQDLPCKRRVRE